MRPGPSGPVYGMMRWLLLIAVPLLVFTLLDPVGADRALGQLPDLRGLILWFPAVIAGTFLHRYVRWRRATRQDPPRHR